MKHKERWRAYVINRYRLRTGEWLTNAEVAMREPDPVVVDKLVRWYRDWIAVRERAKRVAKRVTAMSSAEKLKVRDADDILAGYKDIDLEVREGDRVAFGAYYRGGNNRFAVKDMPIEQVKRLIEWKMGDPAMKRIMPQQERRRRPKRGAQ